MVLSQFGSIFKFALQLEEKLAEFYEQASEEDKVNAEEFARRAKACRIRKRKLEESRRLNVTEMILEPIEGLDESDYQLDLILTPEAINAIEETASRFYADAGPKINVLEARRIFKLCQKGHSKLDKIASDS
ncbi:MAG: hypothetical protein ACFFGZ_17065 [Candidatus Thorarchaeota archaeon]